MKSLLLLPLALCLSGCVAKTLVDVVTLPVKVASKGVDAATTSQSESDEKRGRDARKRDERIGKLQRDRAKILPKCERGDGDACQDVEAIDQALEDERYGPY